MGAKLFDSNLRVMRRDRAFRQGPVLFAYRRAFEDIAERLAEVSRSFDSALLIGAPDPSFPTQLNRFAARVEAVDPGRLFAAAARARHWREEQLEFEPGSFALCVALGTLDQVDDLPAVLKTMRGWLAPDGLLIGVMAGGETLPRLRSAMRAADLSSGAASPHVHPRIEASALGHLLVAAGFVMPVVDVDRVKVAYSSLASLVADLRAMGVTNLLRSRSRFVSRAALAAAEADFGKSASGGRTIETFELLHFAAWTAKQG